MIYVLIAWAFVAVLLQMRTRWRRADDAAAADPGGRGERAAGDRDPVRAAGEPGPTTRRDRRVQTGPAGEDA